MAAAETAEICGLLLGRGNAISAIRPAVNVASDPCRHFEIDPATLIAAHRAARGDGPAVLGHYHSHPSGLARPSAADAAQAATDGALWLIVAGDAVTLWRTHSDAQGATAFAAVQLVVVDEAGLASPDGAAH
jgi:proteasome lid subunit RPN8/RPN11